MTTSRNLMNRKALASRGLGLAAALALATAAGPAAPHPDERKVAMEAAAAKAKEAITITPRAARPSTKGPAENFTGSVRVEPLFAPTAHTRGAAASVTFSPCARSAWHSHPAGQTLIVTSGRGWVQEWGGSRRDITVGDVIWTPPGVKHWHGATATDEMTHIAIQEQVQGRVVDWMEHVSDEQYGHSTCAPASMRSEETHVWMSVGERRFPVTLADSAAARALAGQLPLRLDMSELNGNEKHASLPKALPAHASRPGTIRAGDIMLYGTDTLVVFYQTFDSSYSYTRLGRVKDPAKLAGALGDGDARVVFSAE
jgi:quercetin dioxygenase-like cupin family protein